MNIALDIIILAIIIINLVVSWRMGFVKMVLQSLTVVAALAAAFMLVVPVRDAIAKTDFAKSAQDKIQISVVSVLEGLGNNSDDADTNQEKNDASRISELLSYAGLDGDEIKEDVDNWISTQSEELKVSIADRVAPVLLNAFLTFVSFAAVFFAALIVISLAVAILNKFTKLPVLKQANTLLGVVLGLILALVEISIFTSLVQTILPYNAMLGGILSEVSPENTYLFKIFCNYNIFSLLF